MRASGPLAGNAWIALGAGGALMAGGAVFGLKARSTKSDLEKAWASPATPRRTTTKSSSVKTAALVSNLCWVAGVGFDRPRHLALLQEPRPEGGGRPAVGDGQLALVASGSF